MHVHPYERGWLWGATAIICLGLGTVLYQGLMEASAPPSHIETIDPKKVMADQRFSVPGVRTNPDGSATVVVIAAMFAFIPGEIHVPAGRPVTFRITSTDVIHGFQIVGTNGNAMVVPGYVNEFTTTFAAGDYLIVCNEFCGVGHHVMSARLFAEATP
jgi:cytochrome c oxidase subunit II